MELRELFPLYRRWIWLLALGLILGLGAGYLASKIQTPIYEVSTKVLVTRTRQQGVTDILAMSDQQLVLTYLQLLKTRPVLEQASSRLGIKIRRDNINAEIISDTQIIQITVQDKNPEQAAAIANTLVQILIEKNETLQAGRYSAYEEGLNSQIAQVQKQIDGLQGQITQINQANIQEQLDQVNKQIADLQTEISTLENDISKFPAILSAVDRARLAETQTQLDQLRSLLYLYQEIQTNLTFIGKPLQGGSGSDDPRVTSLQSTLNLYQQLYLNLLNNVTTVKLARVQSTPTVSPIEEASVPERPVRPVPLLYTLLSGIVGFVLAAGAILMIDYFDDTLKSAQKVREVLDLPVIGQIAEATQTNKSGGGLQAFNQTGSILANAFGSLRINVSRLMEEVPTKTILITSPGLGEGKTTISLNLAAAFVRSGKKVVLLDADFYHPQVHARLGLNNERGLASILDDNMDWQMVARDFGGINVITSGSDSPSSSALLETEHMSALLTKLNKEVDLVIVDGPPLSVVDSQILASQVGGILLVIRQGSTITAVARAMLDQLKLMEANVLGTVLNRIPRADAYYFNGYHRFIPAEKPVENLEKIDVEHIL